MKVSYDRDEDILLIEMAERTGDAMDVMDAAAIDHAEHTGSVIAHFARDGRLSLLEILGASEFLSSAIKASTRGEDQVVPDAPRPALSRG